MELKDEADLAIAEGHARLVVHLVDLGVTDPHAPGVEAVEPAHHVQQRALADARRADDREHLALLDLEIEAAQHVDPRRRRRIRLDEARDLDECHRYSYLSASAGSSRPAWRAG